MADDTTGAEGTATGQDAAGQGQGQPSGTAGQGQGSAGNAAQGAAGGQTPGAAEGGSGTGSTAAGNQGAEDQSPEEMLADAVGAGNGQGSGEDPLKAAQAEAARWKKQARDNETRAKANADKAKQFDAYQESQMTEQQRLAARAEAAEQRASAAEGLYRRTLAAATYDLPPSMIDQLGDGTEEEISARAETLAAAINERAAVLAAAQAQANGQQQQRGGGGFRPVESLRPGALPAGETSAKDPNAWVRQMLAKK
jgi:hypothetical protein